MPFSYLKKPHLLLHIQAKFITPLDPRQERKSPVKVAFQL